MAATFTSSGWTLRMGAFPDGTPRFITPDDEGDSPHKHYDHFISWLRLNSEETGTIYYWSGRQHRQVLKAATSLGRKGGHSRSAAKQEAARANGRLGGRPRGS